MDLARSITNLENNLATLIREWDRFFCGDRKVPPVSERLALERGLRRLVEHPARQRALQFKVEQLQHRFMTYAQMWERMLREREEGRGTFALKRAAGATLPPPPPPPLPRTEPDKPAAASVDKGSREETLFDRYIAARQQVGQSTSIDKQVFSSQIAEKQKKLEAKLGNKVKFDVVVEDGKVRLAARKLSNKP